MHHEKNIYKAVSEKPVSRFVEDFSRIIKENDFLISNPAAMDMKQTFDRHGGTVPDDFDLHMIQICKPTKADKSLSTNPERAILMPKFVHVFSKEKKTHIRYLNFSEEHVSALIPGDEKFPQSLTQTHNAICAMIDRAC